jgi:hypothetical protein
MPAKPVKLWFREMMILDRLARGRGAGGEAKGERDDHE